MRPEPGQVLHFSEDPTITRFVPHVAPTAKQPGAFVWAVGFDRAPDYWFPRQCPRAMAWVGPDTSEADRLWLGAPRVHAVEYGWLTRIQSTDLFGYRFAAAPFRPLFDHAVVATEPVEPLGPAEPVGDLLAAHAGADIELRLMTDLWGFWDRVTASTLEFSGIRLANASPRR
ncbi:hypothetical protein R8Z50_01520 [Longispora sp. K20-0274]|uniref:DUF6886 family protein n=1 Tax=Longispora sp. K20-0274 TaxID=3088255 RepID=UPI0039994D42